ncbi:hypothetical protein CP965_06020 [Halarcobacter mediterraneus]|uniref:Porin domain-containing protein n=1 Tax=Halarcobacter mediterraneus TaxID=2023153 RepID=A0A4Q1B3F9_9BACT|nr:porin [Halarcobacter mediterraneus]RXK13355.1 hypothetical protein CP965_06020 [Halarcobacter mediterraneus]
MTKITKLSLIAALTVAGTSACAQPLTEAIKNVDVSGTVAYRYNDYEEASDHANNNYKIGLNLSSKVNDDVTANTRFIIGAGTGEASLGTSTDSDRNVDVTLSEVNFTYTGVKGLAVTVGKQAIDTPWTVARDSMGNEQTGTGLVAVYNVGPATLVGAYFNQTNFNTTEASSELTDAGLTALDGSEDIYVVGAMATFAGVTLDAFYADLDDVFDSYTVGLAANYDVSGVKLSPFARYTSLDLDAADLDNNLWQLGLTAKAGIFEGFVAYGETDDEGGVVYFDSGAKTNMDYHWRVTAEGQGDAEYLYVHATADVTDNINVGLFYSEADYTTDNDINEVYAQVKYQMSSNFATYVRFGELSVDNTDEDGSMGRLHVEYSF